MFNGRFEERKLVWGPVNYLLRHTIELGGKTFEKILFGSAEKGHSLLEIRERIIEKSQGKDMCLVLSDKQKDSLSKMVGMDLSKTLCFVLGDLLKLLCRYYDAKDITNTQFRYPDERERQQKTDNLKQFLQIKKDIKLMREWAAFLSAIVLSGL